MGRHKLTIETRRVLHENNFFVSSLWQPPSMFPDDGRRLKNVAQPGDPWIAQIFYPEHVDESGRTYSFWAMFIQWGRGDTAEEAVQDALRKALGLEGRLRKLAAAMNLLSGTISGRAPDQDA